MDFSFELLTLFFLVAVCAGLLDTLAGGGGLITIPALVLAGAPPLAALGTNKLQGCVGTATAWRRSRCSYWQIKSSGYWDW